MTRFWLRILNWILPLLIISCGDEPGINKPIRPVIFSLKTLINDQVKELNQDDFTVDKTTYIEDRKEEIFFKPDSGFWNKEFEIFLTADIGKPSLRDSYSIHESDSSGYHLVNYTAIDPDIRGTKYLLLRLDSLGILKEIELLFEENNFIYHSHRILRMKFSRAASMHGNIVESYNIKGFQKILFRNPVSYEVDASISQVK